MPCFRGIGLSGLRMQALTDLYRQTKRVRSIAAAVRALESRAAWGAWGLLDYVR